MAEDDTPEEESLEREEKQSEAKRWAQDEFTQGVIRAQREECLNYVKALVNTCGTSTDPNVRTLHGIYTQARLTLERFYMADGKTKTGLP